MSDMPDKPETVTLMKTDSKRVSVIDPKRDAELTLYYEVYRYYPQSVSGFVLVDENILLEMVNQINSAREAEKRRKETEQMASANVENPCQT